MITQYWNKVGCTLFMNYRFTIFSQFILPSDGVFRNELQGRWVYNTFQMYTFSKVLKHYYKFISLLTGAGARAP